MRKNEKWDFLDEKSKAREISEADLDIFEKLSTDKNDFIRDEAATVLYYSDSPRAEQILLNMLKDKSADVRSSVCDSLCISNSANTIEILKPYALNDTDLLVRGCSLFSIIDIAIKLNVNSNELITFFEQGLQKENEPWVRAAYHYVLYRSGKGEYLQLFLEGLNNEDYHIRCLTANLLSNVVNSENEDIIKAALDDRLKAEATVAVKSSIENTLREFNNL